MEEKKTFIINCDICDARKVNEETLAEYEKIIINGDVLVVDERSKEALNRLPIVYNVDQVMELEQDTEFVVRNGACEISGDASAPKKTVMVVNGTLTIHTGSERAMENYCRIFANGLVRYPESMTAYVGNIHANGAVECYPDDSILLDSVFVPDKYFVLRARRGANYYAHEKVLLTDPELDVAGLAEKDVHFLTKTLVVPEEKLEDAILLVNEKTDLQVIPAGYAYVQGNAELTEELFCRYGSRLYIDGDLQFTPESTELLPRLEGLEVTQDILMTEKQLEAFRKIRAKYKNIILKKGKILKNRVNATLDLLVLEDTPEGIQFRNCASVYVDPEVSRERILSDVEFRNCAKIVCTPEQKSAVEVVSKNVAKICDSGDEKDTDNGMDLINHLLVGEGVSRMANADWYVL